MDTKKEKSLNDFINDENVDKKEKNAKKVVMDEREGLVERIDKIFVTKDGKQLLREQY